MNTLTAAVVLAFCSSAAVAAPAHPLNARDAFFPMQLPHGVKPLDDQFDIGRGSDGHSWTLTPKKGSTNDKREAFHLGGPEPLPAGTGSLDHFGSQPSKDGKSWTLTPKKSSNEDKRDAFHLGGPEPLPVGFDSLDNHFNSKPSKDGNSWELTPKKDSKEGKRDAFHLGGPEPIPTEDGWEMPEPVKSKPNFPGFGSLETKGGGKPDVEARHEEHGGGNFKTVPHNPGQFGPNDPGFFGP